MLQDRSKKISPSIGATHHAFCPWGATWACIHMSLASFGNRRARASSRGQRQGFGGGRNTVPGYYGLRRRLRRSDKFGVWGAEKVSVKKKPKKKTICGRGKETEEEEDNKKKFTSESQPIESRLGRCIPIFAIAKHLVSGALKPIIKKQGALCHSAAQSSYSAVT